MKTLILGLGNPLVTDDSVGLRVAEELKPLLADRTDVEVSEDYWGGLRLMERMIGFDRAIVIDAIQTGAPPGTIHLLDARRHPHAAERLGPRRESCRPPWTSAARPARTCPKTTRSGLSESRPRIYLLSVSNVRPRSRRPFPGRSKPY